MHILHAWEEGCPAVLGAPLEHEAMRKFHSKIAPVFILTIASMGALVPLFQAQNIGSTVTVSPVPDGASFSVDGQNYSHAMSAIWPAGSKHILSVDSTLQNGGNKIQYNFTGWTYSIGSLPGNTVTITADPQFTWYKANFQLQYALTLVFVSCPDPTNCVTPGTIYVNGAPYTSSQDIYLQAGSTATLIASPNPGWVFVGWNPTSGQTLTSTGGTVSTVTMNAPTSVYPIFKQARTINLASAPSGLTLLADRTKVPTPTALDWGWDTTHTLGVVTPQQDNQGNWWAFQSWSDGGALTHSYTVADSQQPDTVTATFVAGAGASITTTPPGLSLTIDGRSNWTSYNFVWGVGETHHLQAPPQQTDSQGRAWSFTSWSDGGAATHDFVVPASAASNGVHLNATYSPLGHLTVTTSLASLAVQVDGQTCTTPCDVIRPVGSSVHLSAPASVPVMDGVRQDFLGWPGSGSNSTDWSITLTADPINLAANYHLMNRLATASAPPNGANWAISPSSPDNFYDSQTIVNIGVTPLPGYRFHGFTGDLTGTKPSGAVAMNTPRAVQALLDRAPYIAPTGVANAAGTTPQNGVAPGSITSVFGASFATDTATGATNPLPQTLDGVTVMVGDRFIPIFYVSPTQINVQLPDDLPLGTQTLTVNATGLPTVQAGFSVVRNAPGLFAQQVGNQSFAIALHQDGTPVTTDAPAIHGELLTVYGTGFGPADHSRPEGFPVPANPPYLLLDAPTVLVGDSSVLAAANAFVVPGQVGIDAVQFRLDDSSPSGTIATLHVTINGQDSNTVMLAIQ